MLRQTDTKVEDILYEPDLKDNGRQRIRQGSAKALIDALIFPLEQNINYVQEFLFGYRFFMSSMEILEALIAWYNVDCPQDAQKPQMDFWRKSRRAIQNNVVSVLLLWIKHHWQDFLSDKELTKELNVFIQYLSQVSYGDHQKMTQCIREQVRFLLNGNYLYV